MKVISLLVLASTASAFVPGSAPIRTWCVGFCINITPRVGWKEWCDMQSPIEMMGYWKDGRHFEQIAIAIENIYIIWGSYLICVWFCKRGEIMRNLIICSLSSTTYTHKLLSHPFLQIWSEIIINMWRNQYVASPLMPNMLITRPPKRLTTIVLESRDRLILTVSQQITPNGMMRRMDPCLQNTQSLVIKQILNTIWEIN